MYIRSTCDFYYSGLKMDWRRCGLSLWLGRVCHVEDEWDDRNFSHGCEVGLIYLREEGVFFLKDVG